MGKRGGGIKRTAEGVKLDKKDTKKEVSVCYAFTSPGGCSRSSGLVCRYKGREFKHCCSKVEANGFLCGATDHGVLGHE